MFVSKFHNISNLVDPPAGFWMQVDSPESGRQEPKSWIGRDLVLVVWFVLMDYFQQVVRWPTFFLYVLWKDLSDFFWLISSINGLGHQIASKQQDMLNVKCKLSSCSPRGMKDFGVIFGWEQPLTPKKGVNSTTDFNKFKKILGQNTSQ